MKGDAKRIISRLERALPGAFGILGTAGDMSSLALSDRARAWQCLELKPGAAPTREDFSHADNVWVTRYHTMSLEYWEAALSEFMASELAQTLTLVLLDSPTFGGRQRQTLEQAAFDCGLRKHHGYYLMLDYEGLHEDQAPLLVPLEKLPPTARSNFPLASLRSERDLHMDMLREAGRRSDAHVIRYQMAIDLIRPGDRILDAACGLGYGSYVMAQSTRCSRILGIDGSGYAIDYARQNFAAMDSRLRFERGWLPDELSTLPDESFDLVVSFETLEHVADPVGVLNEFSRLLRPGGRIIVSVPNDWSDETGKDPNPHHLHVYTLDTLRQQISGRFRRERLHQLIASGCKRRSNGDKWAPLRRTLRELPVDTALPPDSEWWIMSGRKPCTRGATDMVHPSYAGLRARWEETAEENRMGEGIVLAMHAVPAEVDPHVEAFWSALNQELSQHGYSLMLLSTTTMKDPSLQVIEMPFLLPSFAENFPALTSTSAAVDERAIHDAMNWYRCSYQQACDSVRVAHAFFEDLLDTLRPAAVLGWQGVNPVTRLLKGHVKAAEIPWWCGERGWVRNTLLFDLDGAHFLGEMNTSLASARRRRDYRPAGEVIERLQNRARSAADLGRYAQGERTSGAMLRQQLDIPEDAKVAVLFTHGEPSLNAMGTALVREMHDLSTTKLQTRVNEVAAVLVKRGYWLLVQEHPFNIQYDRCLSLPQSPRVRTVRENVSSLLDASNLTLYTLATLQFDAVFFDKPLGLLSRSALYRDGDPPFIGDFPTADAFVDALVDFAAWPARFERLQAQMAFIYEQLSLDIEPQAAASSAQEWASHLMQFRRPVDDRLPERIDRFLGFWTTTHEGQAT